MGMKGESKYDSTVMVVKTHYPERSGMGMFNCKKAILIVRNPLDAIASLFNMIATGSHSESIGDSKL